MKDRIRRLSAYVSMACLAVAVTAQSAMAAASPLTGIDYKVDLADPAVAEAKLPILGALGLFLLFVGIAVFRKVWTKVTKTG